MLESEDRFYAVAFNLLYFEDRVAVRSRALQMVVAESGTLARVLGASWRCDLRAWEEKSELVLGLVEMRKPRSCVRGASGWLRGLVFCD